MMGTGGVVFENQQERDGGETRNGNVNEKGVEVLKREDFGGKSTFF